MPAGLLISAAGVFGQGLHEYAVERVHVHGPLVGETGPQGGGPASSPGAHRAAGLERGKPGVSTHP